MTSKPPRDPDDLLAGPVPEPDAAPTAAERAHARTFADLVDKTLAGRTPPAMSTDDRALLEVATVIRAARGHAELDGDRREAIVEDVLRQAIGGAGARAMPGVVPLSRARARRWAPWAVAATSTLVAAAALVALWLRTPHRAPGVAPAAAAVVPMAWRSRPADPLIGPIDKARDGDAGTRIDAIFADRLEGFRERRLASGRKP